MVPYLPTTVTYRRNYWCFSLRTNVIYFINHTFYFLFSIMKFWNGPVLAALLLRDQEALNQQVESLIKPFEKLGRSTADYALPISLNLYAHLITSC